MMVCYRVDGRAGGKGRQPPGCGEWQGLLPGCTDCSRVINHEPHKHQPTMQCLDSQELGCCGILVLPLISSL